MSIKRTKQRSSPAARRLGEHAGFGNKKQEAEKNWQADVAAQPETAFVPYAVTNHYDKGVLIAHSSFGKGLVVQVDGPRIEVLFETGKKKLGHVAR